MSTNFVRSDGEERYAVLTYVIVAWCIVVYLALTLQGNLAPDAAARWGYVTEWSVYRGAVWGLVTTALVHVETMHLLFNLYWLYILGSTFEKRFGSGFYLLFLAVAAFLSSGVQLASGTMGIGLSGVGYALFGFAWVGRKRYPEFARIVSDQVVFVFVAWGLFCIVATQLHWMNIGNLAHAAGLAIGATVAGIVAYPKTRPLLSVGALLLVVLGSLPLYWNPMSVEWVSRQAFLASRHQDFPRAIAMFRRSLELGGDESWAWTSLAVIYGQQGDKVHYKEAIDRLRKVDRASADSLVTEFGSPEGEGPGSSGG